MSADPRSRPERRRDTEHRLTHDIDVWVASASADGAPVSGTAVLRLGRRGAAGGHADGQPEGSQNPILRPDQGFGTLHAGITPDFAETPCQPEGYVLRPPASLRHTPVVSKVGLGGEQMTIFRIAGPPVSARPTAGYSTRSSARPVLLSRPARPRRHLRAAASGNIVLTPFTLGD